jgi:amino acid permease
MDVFIWNFNKALLYSKTFACMLNSSTHSNSVVHLLFMISQFRFNEIILVQIHFLKSISYIHHLESSYKLVVCIAI